MVPLIQLRTQNKKIRTPRYAALWSIFSRVGARAPSCPFMCERRRAIIPAPPPKPPSGVWIRPLSPPPPLSGPSSHDGALPPAAAPVSRAAVHIHILLGAAVGPVAAAC